MFGYPFPLSVYPSANNSVQGISDGGSTGNSGGPLLKSSMVRAMSYHLYNVRIEGNRYRVVKFSDDFNVLSINYVWNTARGRKCSCRKGGTPYCRHRAIVSVFVQERKVDTGYFWSYDDGHWEVPVNHILREMRMRSGR